MVLRPTPQQQQEANTCINTEPIETTEEIPQAIQDHHETHASTMYTFDDGAYNLLQQMNEEFTQEVNMAILDGNMPPKSKRSDHLPRIALHVLNYATEMLLLVQPIDDCRTVINTKTFATHLEQQKDAVCQVSLHEKYSTFKATSVSCKTANLIFIHVLASLVVLTVLPTHTKKLKPKYQIQ